MHAVGNAGEHGGAAGEDGVGVQVLTDVNIALHDGVVGALVDAGLLHADERRLEEGLGAAEALVADGDDLAVGQLVGLLEAGAGGSGLHLLLEVEGDVAKLLLDVTHNFALGGGGEGVTALGQDLHEVVSQIVASQVQTEDGVGKSVTLVDGHGVGDTVSGVEHDAGGAAGGAQGQHGLDGATDPDGVLALGGSDEERKKIVPLVSVVRKSLALPWCHVVVDAGAAVGRDVNAGDVVDGAWRAGAVGGGVQVPLVAVRRCRWWRRGRCGRCGS